MGPTDRVNEQRLYRDLAWTFPIISPLGLYVDECAAIRAALTQHSARPVETLLHLGSGGGHGDHFFKEFARVTGLDLSPEMIGLARRLNPECEYRLGDMTRTRLGRTFSGVVITDALDYMLTLGDLRAVFATGQAHLDPGGVLVTYFNVTKETFQQDRVTQATHALPDGSLTFIEHFHDPDPADTTYDMVLISLIRRQGRLKIETDHHLNGVFEADDIRECIHSAGLTLVEWRPESFGILVAAVRSGER